MRDPRQRFMPVIVGALLLALPGMALAQSSGLTGPLGLAAGDALFLEPVALGPVGSVAFFVIEQTADVRISDQTGFFTLMSEEDIGEQLTAAVRARIEVLEPDPESGSPRVRVQAQAIDPETREPVSGRIWDGVYVFGDKEAYLVEGDEPTAEEYQQMVNPRWLANLLSSAQEDLPGPPLRPGDRWQSLTAAPELEELGLEGGTLPLDGEFTGWVDVPVGRAAVLVESVNIQNTVRQPVGENLAFDVDYTVVGQSQAWVVPGDFPYMMIGSMEGDLVFATADMEDSPLAGSMRMKMVYGQRIERELGGSLQAYTAPAPDLPVLEIGATVTGFLGEDSEDFGDGTWADFYVLYGETGDVIAIRMYAMYAEEFDAYLEIWDDTRSMLHWGDDTDGGTDAELYITLPYTGLYYVVANSYFADEGGDYTLTVTREPAPEWLGGRGR
ncbi:MAG TPA: hypothetical protein VIK98_03535 [Limnochordales bacterium]